MYNSYKMCSEVEASIINLRKINNMTCVTEYVSTDQTDSVAPAVRTMTKWAEQCRADTGVASWMAGRSRRPQEENTDNILS